MTQRRVYVHVGAPKTGTTYLQDRLALNAASLKRHGYRYPTGTNPDMFLAALDLLDRPWGGMRPQAEGEWEALVRRTRRARGTVVLSHEILAGAKPGEARRALDDLSFAEVHVVYSARDVARQVAAEWQEQLKHQRKVSFRTFLKQIRESDQRGGSKRATRWFWRVQGLPGVLERWGNGLAPSRVHVVTVPRPGGPPEELWQRFCTALGIDPAWAPREGARSNPSIGAAEATLLRRVNVRLKEAGLPSDSYRALVRQLVVHETLALRPRMTPVTLPPDAYDWAEEVAQGWIDWVKGAGVDVVGDLDELRPVRPPDGTEWHDPDRPRPREVTSAAVDAIVALTMEAARRPDPDDTLTSRAARWARLLRR
ncbi:MAG TPA: hypothetical protein VFV89_10290 [Nocardioides sp.]|uniref:hypothetical protein n=1 Tax=Nocardioides sp. TaxID=35761 RepID=UPI002E37F524|nr:hypothetical protein [Nocardioides sp.]HEX5088187.1 hypothetical protein [Nocardioides sp.]